eukprot:COSAG02_NODE_381_length_23450_cov_65.782493_15_plen_77_part_00
MLDDGAGIHACTHDCMTVGVTTWRMCAHAVNAIQVFTVKVMCTFLPPGNDGGSVMDIDIKAYARSISEHYARILMA